MAIASQQQTNRPRQRDVMTPLFNASSVWAPRHLEINAPHSLRSESHWRHPRLAISHGRCEAGRFFSCQSPGSTNMRARLAEPACNGGIRRAKLGEANRGAAAQGNPIRPRYRKPRAANLPDLTKPDTGGEARGESGHPALQGGWGRHMEKDQQGAWETQRSGPVLGPTPKGNA